MKTSSILFKDFDNIRNSVSMGISNFSNLINWVIINKLKFTDMESSNNRIRFHEYMIIE